MGKIYEKAKDDVAAVMREALANYHPELHALGPSIGLTMVTPNKDEEGTPTVPAINLSSVLFPAPFRPTKPMRSPLLITRFRSLSAQKSAQAARLRGRKRSNPNASRKRSDGLA